MERSDKRQTLKLNTTGLVVPITLTILGLAADISEILLLNSSHCLIIIEDK